MQLLDLFARAMPRATAEMLNAVPAPYRKTVFAVIYRIPKPRGRGNGHSDREDLRMIAKPTTSGEFAPEAQDGTGRVRTGPFPTHAAARRRIDQNQVFDTPKVSPDPRRVPPVHQPRTNKSVTFAYVETLTEGMLARPDLIDIEHEFILSIWKQAMRAMRYLRITTAIGMVAQPREEIRTRDREKEGSMSDSSELLFPAHEIEEFEDGYCPLPVPMLPGEIITVQQAAYYAGFGERTIRGWRKRLGIGRQPEHNGPIQISIIALEMALAGRRDAIELLRNGDREHRLVRHFTKLAYEYHGVKLRP